MPSPNCVFVIIGYNNSLITQDCVESFLRHVPGVSLWLYDNASTPTLKPMAEKFGLPYLYSDTNLGFSGGANRAIQWVLDDATVAVVCIVNNDILLSNHFAMTLNAELSAFIADEHLAAMTPLLYLDPHYQKPENFGILYYQSGMAFQNRTGKIKGGVLLNGAFLFLKTAVCERLVREDGFVFRPLYFFNAEDVELSLRLLSRGFKLLVNPNLAVQHLGSQSSRSASKQSFVLAWRNLLWTLFITRSNTQLLRDAPFVIAGQLIQVVLAVLHGHPELFLRVLTETFLHRDQLVSSRRHFLTLKRREFGDFIKAGVF
jgi:GT2 family glycosyltransferase